LQLVFGNIPSIETKIKVSKEESKFYRFMIIDLTCVHRVETSAVELLEREARENVETRALVFCGVSTDSAVYSDLQRGGLRLNYGTQRILILSLEMMQKGPMGFEERADAIRWCKSQVELGKPVQSLCKKPQNEGQSPILLTILVI